MHSSKETSYEMTARPAWMRADQREPLSRQTRIAGLVALTTLLLVTLYTFVDPTSIEAATQALSLVGKQPDVVWQTLGALDPHTQPVTSRNITSAATVAPFFIRARRAGTYDREDVTAFSMATSDRLDMLEMLAEQYQGPVSLAFWVPFTDQQARKAALGKLQDLVKRSKAVRDWVDVHLVSEDRKLELNRWRNVARRYARTDYVLMHDIDFWLPPGFRSTLADPQVQAALEEGRQAFAVPCFIAQDDELAVQPQRYPETKQALLQLVKANKFDMPVPEWQPAHGATNYPHWYTLPATSKDFYKISSPRPSAYEPYLVFNTHTAPYCPEVFNRWSDKAACVHEMYLAGIDMRVLPGAFSLHVGVKGADPMNGIHRWANAEFENWERESCHKYLGYFSKYDLLNDPVASQFRETCLKWPGIEELQSQLNDAAKQAFQEGSVLR